MSVEDFFYSLFKTGKSLTPSASTPYRQLKRHLSMQVRDQRTCVPSPRKVEVRQPCKVEVSVDYLVRPVLGKKRRINRICFSE